MRYRDTTTPFSPNSHATIFTEESAPAVLLQTQALHFELIGLFYCEAGPQWDSHGQAESDCFHHINLVIRGDARVRHGDTQLALLPGHAYFFPAATPTVRECNEGYEVLWLRFRCSWLSRLDPLLHWPERRPLCLGLWEPDEWHVPLKGNVLPASCMLLRWQSRLTRWFADALPDLDSILREHATAHAPFAAVFDHIDKNLGADLRMNALADAYGASVQAFARHFTKIIGQSPKTYLSSRLNQQAIRLVLGSALTMKQIAAELRFSDEYYFSRFFTRLNGVSPTHYRKRLRGNTAAAEASSPPTRTEVSQS